MNKNTHTQLQLLISTKLAEFNNNSRKVIAYLKIEGLWEDVVSLVGKPFNTDGELLYNFQYQNDKHCPSNLVKFVSFAVGYRYCGSKCECCIKSKRSSCINSKQLLTDEDKAKINEKRYETNIVKYGYDNYFRSAERVKQSLETKYAVSNAREIPGVNDKIKNTCLEKYGVDNPAKNEHIKTKSSAAWKINSISHMKKLKSVLTEKYGVTNARDIPGVNDKIKNTCLEKYGVDNIFKLTTAQNCIKETRRDNFYNNIPDRVSNVVIPLFDVAEYNGTTERYCWKCTTCSHEFEDTIINGRTPICRKCNPYTISKFEIDFRNTMLSNYDVEFNSRNVIPPREIDCFLPSYRLAIECNGVYWHSEAKGKDKKYHVNKTEQCDELGIQLLHIWDIEWYNQRDIVTSVINSYLKKNKTLYARKGRISIVSNADKKLFLQNNHLQGDAASSVNLGLYINNELTALMTFGKSRFNKTIEWELVRYCQLTHTNVVGGASKLFLYFVRNFSPTTIITYADRRWFSGNMYKHLGFEFSHNSTPNYFYFSLNSQPSLVSRIKFQKHKQKDLLATFDPALTEWENMQNNNYTRIWDCGNSVWIYKINKKG